MKSECTFNWFGQNWICKRVKNVEGLNEPLGGCIDPANKVVYINETYDQESFLDYLHHELTEGAMFLNACCFSRNYPDSKDMFILDHSQMDIISGAVRGAYEMVRRNIGIDESKITGVSKNKTRTKTRGSNRKNTKKGSSKS